MSATMKSEACPSDVELQAFAIGDLPTTVLEQIETHVENCERCQNSLQACDVHRDSLLHALTEQAPTIANPIPVPERVLTSAKAALMTTSNGRSHDLALDSGRHYARLLKEGACRTGPHRGH
jgi:eukaryotic-like serine/threonine-protein kinase